MGRKKVEIKAIQDKTLRSVSELFANLIPCKRSVLRRGREAYWRKRWSCQF